jgi:hypothetical protein
MGKKEETRARSTYLSLKIRIIEMIQELQTANLFELSSRGIQVTYSTTSITGKPLFSYRDAFISKQFQGDEILLEESRIGQLVTVVLEQVPDLKTVTFTLILPTVKKLPSSTGTAVEVPGIMATAHTSIIGPGLGPSITYRQVMLSGTAQFVVS